MNKSTMVAALLLMAGGVGAGFFLAQSTSIQKSQLDEKEILYWVAPMDAAFRRNKPGKSPMGMDLIPVYSEDADGMNDGEPALKLNPAVVNNIGVRTTKVQRSDLNRMIDAVGFIEPDDDLTSVLHVRSEGWIERLTVKTEGARVDKGDTLFQFYSPVIATAQTEFIQAVRIGRATNVKAANERLISLGMEQGQIDSLRKSGIAKRLVDIRAQQAGVILKLTVREGAYVQPGMTVLSLADLNSIWVQVQIFEDQASWVENGQRVIMHLPFIPGRIWEGVVDYVYPTVSQVSRTIRVRLKFENFDQILKPGMYAEISIYGSELEDTLSIPREALIRTGKSERVILALGKGRFRPAQVVSGAEVGDRVEILSGLREGETVVTSSQFLIDSEASLVGGLLRMGNSIKSPPAVDVMTNMPSVSDTVRPIAIKTQGVVNSVMPDHNMINITHDPIEVLNWPVMTMNFTTSENVDLTRLAKGDVVNFTLMPHGDGSYMVTSISPVSAEDSQ